MSMDDLLQWARVNKKWHYAVIPYIWRDMSTLTKSQHKRLVRMIIDDYRRVQTGGSPSSLAKYCPLIRTFGTISDPKDAKDEYSSILLRFVQRDKKISPDDKESTAQSIFHHFMVHCTHLQTLMLDLSDSGSYEPAKAVADTRAQQLRQLTIRGSLNDEGFKSLLSRCSTTMEVLYIYSTPPVKNSNHPAIEVDEAEQEQLSSLRRLFLICCPEHDADRLRSIWGRCKSLQELVFVRCDLAFLKLTANLVEKSLPNLRSIALGPDTNEFDLEDKDLACLLSASQLGWRSIQIMGYRNLGALSWRVLFRNTPKIWRFTMVKWYGQNDDKLMEILLTSPWLQKLVTLQDGVIDYPRIISIDANEWIRRKPSIGPIAPLPCGSFLTDLRIKISDIPRPDVTHDRNGEKRRSSVNESYPGEGQKIQRQVYERLSNFVLLEVLWLGSNSYYCQSADLHHKKVADHQYECLEMSLESGLDQLEGMKRMKILNVSLMETRIGQKEAQWMAEHWPKLREIHGLENRGDAKKARQWIKENSPRISAPFLSTK
ncbi:hypothetical protein BGX34_001857 [Mortierella sp. NVP85]|nr:hypothetical protein BGX34_001857 [Mortierella sp. NVP85]